MNKPKLLIKDLLLDKGRVDLKLSLVAGKKGLGKEIQSFDINRPGLTLAGFFDFFASDRIQIFGLGETAYLRSLPADRKKEIYERFFSYNILCCVFTHSEEPESLFLDYADQHTVPTFITSYTTTRFITHVTHIIEEVLAPVAHIHGTLVAVYGIGVLILGKSGIGKSETALELLERNHILVADDVVIARMTNESLIMGSSSDLLRHHLEIRGLGIINVRDIFGIRSVRNRKRIEMVARLEEWDSNKEYDRLGLDEETYSILDIDIPIITIPVRPGRNIPVIIETAALNHRLKKMGVYTARELDQKIQDWIKTQGYANDV